MTFLTITMIIFLMLIALYFIRDSARAWSECETQKEYKKLYQSWAQSTMEELQRWKPEREKDGKFKRRGV